MLPKASVSKSLITLAVCLMAVALPPNSPKSFAQGTPFLEEYTPAERATVAIFRLVNEGNLRYQQGQYQAAITAFQQALVLARKDALNEAEAPILLRLGMAYASLGQKEQAISYYNQAQPLLRNIKNQTVQAVALNGMGVISSGIGQQEKALTEFNQALSIFRELKTRSMEAVVLANIGSVYFQLKQPQPAIDAFSQALPLLRESKNRSTEGLVLLLMGTIYNDLGQKAKALDSFNLALPILREVKNSQAEKTVLTNLGIGYTQLGSELLGNNQPQAAIAAYTQAAKIWREAKDPLEAGVLNLIAEVYQNISQPRQALAFYNQALAIWREAKIDQGQATALANIGKVYSDLGEPQKALDYYTQSLELRRKLKDRPGEGTILNNIGATYANMGQFEKALDYYNQALAIRREVKAPLGEATTLNNMGGVYKDLGQFEKAFDYYNQALLIWQKKQHRPGEVTALNNIAAVYVSLGQPEKALESFQQVLSLQQALKNRTAVGNTLNNIGSVYLTLAQPAKALEYLTQALPILRESQSRPLEANALNNIGGAYNQLGVSERALDFYLQALKITRQVQNRSGEAVTLSNVGATYERLGQSAKAQDYYTQSLAVAREFKNRSAEAITLANLARLAQRHNNLETALTHIGTAINILETARAEIRDTELRSSYFASVQDFYKLQIDILMQLHKQKPQQGYNLMALKISEQARARGLNDLINESRINIREGVDPTLLEREHSLVSQLQTLGNQRVQLLATQTSIGQIKQLEQNYAALQGQYQQIQSQIRAASPRYAALTQPQALTASQIQALLDDNTLLLEYSMGYDRSYLWLVSRNGVTSYELPKAQEIGALVRRYYSLLTDKDVLTFKKAELEQVGQQLSRILLGPIANQLGQKRLVVVADGALFYLPFAALPQPNGQQPLITQHEIVHLPSATTLALLRQDNNRRSAPKTLAVLADPVFGKDDPRLGSVRPPQVVAQAPTPLRFVTRGDTLLARLPYTAVEAQNILRLAPATQQQSWLGFAANLQNAISPQLAEYQIVHFATHGIFNSQNPERSGLIFSRLTPTGTFQNSDLTLQEIFNLKLKADLVVLSACQTGLGQSIENVQDIQGEGLVGLTRGFMYAGTPRVLVSLWSVNDQSTATLMSQFYQNKLAKGMTPAAALRQAQLEMLKNPQYQSPFYWAPFILQGEWR